MGYNDIIAVNDQSVFPIDIDGKSHQSFSRLPNIGIWDPVSVNVYKGGEQPFYIVANGCSLDEGGGVYKFTTDGDFSGNRVRVYKPYDSAPLDDRRVAVLVSGRMDVYDMESGNLITSTQNTTQFGARYKIKQLHGQYISISPLTHEIIVSYAGGVIALSSTGLAPRWVYRCREGGAGELCEPGSVCVDKEGRVLVCDRDNRRIVVLSQNGKYLATLSTGSFIEPRHISLTRQGQLVMYSYGEIYFTEYLEN